MIRHRASTLDLRFAVCVCNEGYSASLEPRKIYRVLSDPDAGARGMVRIVDESGEDYLYPANFFLPIKLTKPLQKIIGASRSPNE